MQISAIYLEAERLNNFSHTIKYISELLQKQTFFISIISINRINIIDNEW